jgi:hypothetical protein
MNTLLRCGKKGERYGGTVRTVKSVVHVILNIPEVILNIAEMRALPNLAESNGKTKLPEISQKEKCYF